MTTFINTPTKRVLMASGFAATAVIALPAGVGATSYSSNGYDTGQKHHNAGYANAGNYGWQEDDDKDRADREAQRCEKLGYRLDRLNGRFDQYDQDRVMRTQTVIDKINDRDCETDGTIVDALADNGNFGTLIAAVQAAGLADALSAPGDKTVLAPTDQAFANLPTGTVEALLADTPTLAKILTYHVIDGAVDSEAVAGLAESGTEVTTLNGQTVAVEVREDGVYINDSKLVLTDIKTSNGIVHVLDAVLMPQL